MEGPVPGTVPAERFASLFQASQDAIVQADGDGRIVDVNPATGEMFGYDPEELAGEPLTKLMPERYRDQHREGLNRYLKTGKARVIGETVELQGRRKDGTEFPIELTIDTWTAEDDRYFSGIIRDVTDRKETQNQLEQSLQTWEEFGYAISHDLQEPLRSIKGHLQLVDQRLDEVDDEISESIDHAMSGADRLSILIEGLLDYARVQTRGAEFETVELEAVVHDVRQDLEHLLDEEDARVETEDPLPAVHGDAAQIRQLLQNLVENAVKYSGDEPARVRVMGSPVGGGQVELRVHDEGVGVAPEDQENIFRMSYQAEPEAPGSGIGLALCERIVNRHGGSIGVDSAPGEGTTFKITLPAAKTGGTGGQPG